LKICAYRDCGLEFEPARHNQKYCSSDCCKKEMNARAKDAYSKKSARLAGEARWCECGNRLSRYNTSEWCAECESALINDKKDSLKRRLGL
jgi:hypothetical protein